MTAATACRTCGTDPLANARFCHSCGAPITGETQPAEYKQVTVLFADVVRSMDIAAAVGPERLREIMADLVSRAAVVVQRYGGTVDKFTGDGIMAVFGAPVALEDHAVRACFAALGIQDQARQLAAEVERRDGTAFSLRVGLNAGQVIAGEIGSGAPGYTAVGEHVGLAQRMESAAPPGGVMLSESTARSVEHAAVLGEPEMVHIKGAVEPVPARRLIGMASSHAIAGQGESKLVGRGWEMSAAESILERSIEGNGAVVALVGPAGIGKSRMVREIAATAAARGVDVFWAFCEFHASDIPFHVVTQLLRAAVGLPALDEESARARLRERIRDADEQDLLLFDDLLGIRDPDTPVPTIDPDARRRRLSALIKGATVARETPAIYIVEDAHWIDDVSDSMLADFMTVIPQAHSMVLLTYRPEFRGTLTRIPGAQTLTLEPLSNSESATLASELLGPDPTVSDLAKTIAARAAGNPFFAEEIVRDLAERRVINGERGAYRCHMDIAEIIVPATLQATIAARIDRLDSTGKRTLCAAAVIGMRFDADLLDSIGVDPVLEDLLQTDLIDQVKFTRHPEYAFRHPLIRTVAYESQLKADRARLHQRLGAAMESRAASDENAALIAEHLEAAGDLRAAYSWHMRAATWAHSRDIAAAYVSWERARQTADALPAIDPDRLAMQIAPRALMCANGFRSHVAVAGERFEEVQELCAAAGDKASLGMAMAGLMGEQFINGQVSNASGMVPELMSLIESIGDPTLTVALALAPLAIKVITGEMAEVLRYSQMVIDLADGDRARGSLIVGSPLASAYALRSRAEWALGRVGWRDDFNRALAIGRDTDPISRGVVITYTYGAGIGGGVVLADDTALRDIEETLEATQRAADDIALGFAMYAMGVALLHRDSAARERGLDLLKQLKEMAMDGRFYRTNVPLIDVWIGQEMVRREDLDRGVPLLRASVNELYSMGLFSYCVWSTGVLVEALLARGAVSDVHESEAAIERLADLTVLDGWAYRDLVLLRLRALLSRARGDEVTYRTLADQYREMATSLAFEGHIAIAEAMT